MASAVVELDLLGGYENVHHECTELQSAARMRAFQPVHGAAAIGLFPVVSKKGGQVLVEDCCFSA